MALKASRLVEQYLKRSDAAADIVNSDVTARRVLRLARRSVVSGPDPSLTDVHKKMVGQDHILADAHFSLWLALSGRTDTRVVIRADT